jgi:hypothetical protein
MYEITGSIDALSRIEKHELLDKKMVEKPTSDSTLDLKNLSIHEELELYLQHIKVSNVQAILNEFSNTGVVL